MKLFSETRSLGHFSSLGVFPFCFGLLTDATQTCRSVNSYYDSKDSQFSVDYSRMMNSENAPKEMVESFIDLMNMARC